MKTTWNTVIISTTLMTLLIGQTVDELNDEQKINFNRNKLSIEIVGQSTGSYGGYGSGLYGGSISTTSWHQWTAYQGMDKKLTEEEYFRLTGYDEEANKAKERYEKINNNLMLGAALSIGGYLAALIPKTTTETEHYEYLGDIEYEETTYPLL